MTPISRYALLALLLAVALIVSCGIAVFVTSTSIADSLVPLCLFSFILAVVLVMIISVWNTNPLPEEPRAAPQDRPLFVDPPDPAGFAVYYPPIPNRRFDSSAETASRLARAVRDYPTQQMRLRAIRDLERFTDQESIDAICVVWAETRQPDLGEVIARNHWRASAPPGTLVLCALWAGDLDDLRRSEVEWIQPLVQACMDPDPLIAERAGQVLRGLENVAAQEALCRLVSEQENPPARAAAISAGYLPRAEQERALFLFMTGQSERYASHDFDRRLMHSVYLRSPEPLRQNIREKLRSLGRSDFLPIIAGQRDEEQTVEFNPAESELLVQTLIASCRWETLWERLLALPFQWSVRAMEAIRQSGWKPAGAQEQASFVKLAALVEPGSLLDLTEPLDLFSGVNALSTAHLAAGIASVSFAPDRPTLALGTEQGQVILWNYQTAQREQMLRDFEQPIGKVAFCPDGSLVCAEYIGVETMPTMPCSIYVFPDVWNDNNHFRLGTQAGSVTGLVPLSASRLLSSQRGWNVVLWDLSARKEIKSYEARHQARDVRVSRDETELLLVYEEGLDLLSFPDMATITRAWEQGGFSCATFAPDKDRIFAGTRFGRSPLLAYKRSGTRGEHLMPGTIPIRELDKSYENILALEALNKLSLLISAESRGNLRFLSLDQYKQIGNLRVTSIQSRYRTSITVSADESFLAVSSSAGDLTLLDLRLLHVQQMLERPFAQAEPVMLGMVNSLLGNLSLTTSVQRVLQFAQIILYHRVGDTIEIAEASSIAPGEFDIEVD